MGRRIRKLVVALATAMVATTALVVGAAPAAHAAEGCTYNSPITVYARYVVPPTRVELRANSNQVCAWGRITSAAVGDLVWVDRSYNRTNVGAARHYRRHVRNIELHARVQRSGQGYAGVRCAGIGWRRLRLRDLHRLVVKWW